MLLTSPGFTIEQLCTSQYQLSHGVADSLKNTATHRDTVLCDFLPHLTDLQYDLIHLSMHDR
jgi:hypothetical protein